MVEERLDADVVVAGAGTAGSNAAWALAGAGFTVLLLEARSFAEAGARWANLVPVWPFEAAGVALPEPPEALEEDRAYTMLSLTGPGRTRMEGNRPCIHVDCRALVERLQSMGRAAGVQGRDCVQRMTLECDASGRPAVLTGERHPADAAPSRLRVTARLFVDATGTAGHLRRQVPGLAADCPELASNERCLGANEVCEVLDPTAARDFMARLGLEPGDAFAWTGVKGGYSTIVCHLRADANSILVTTGSLGDGLHGSGVEVLRDFKARNPWIGRGIFGGSGLIPIRRPYDRLGAPGIALVGDSGCQVFAAHASGIAIGLLAGRCLADSLAGRTDPGAEDAVWAYQSAFLRTHGPMLGAFDAFRRLSVSLSEAEVGDLVGEGFLQESSIRSALGQKLLAPHVVGEGPALARALMRRPALAAKLAATGARGAAAATVYRAFPTHPDRNALRRWSRTVAAALGGSPDVA